MKYFLSFFVVFLISSLSIFAQNDSISHLIHKETEYNNEKLAKIKAQEDSLRIEQQLNRINSIKASTQGAPVVADLDTIFRIYANLGPYNSLERAKTANGKIASLLKRTFYNPDSLKIKNTFNITTIAYNNEVIVAIDELDALWENTTVDQLAKQQQQLLNDHILQYRKAHSVSNKLKSIGELILILSAFG